jgi:hypothetical protein
MKKSILLCFFSSIFALSNAQTPSNVKAIDLGLPSGTLWANMNIGANSIEEYGDYFSWGEIEAKDKYNEETYKYYDYWVINDSTYIDENGFEIKIEGGTFSGYTKYVNSEASGFKGFYDNKKILDVDDDAAYMNWGHNWRMPTSSQFSELVNNCTWVWASLNGIYGYKVTGKTGNYIFLPASGYREDNPYYPGSLFFDGTMGDYLSCEIGNWVQYGRSLYIDSQRHSTSNWLINGHYNGYRFRGCSVRPVFNGAFVEKCSIPSIFYRNGKLSFTSDTPNTKFVCTIIDNDIATKTTTKELELSAIYQISVYATATGFEKSDIATATLCWIDQQPKTEGITDGIANVPARALLIKNNGSLLTVEGAADGEAISVYTVNGMQSGSAISQNGAASIDTNLQAGSIAIVKIGDKSVKVVIK